MGGFSPGEKRGVVLVFCGFFRGGGGGFEGAPLSRGGVVFFCAGRRFRIFRRRLSCRLSRYSRTPMNPFAPALLFRRRAVLWPGPTLLPQKTQLLPLLSAS